MLAVALRLAPAEPPSRRDAGSPDDDTNSAPDTELAYRVELWDRSRSLVERVLAVTSSSSIGVAAFYASAREFPDRYITLRFRDSVLNRWNPPTH